MPVTSDIVRLKREHQDEICAFLAKSPIENVMLLDRILEDGLPGRNYQEFVGYREDGAWLGVMYFAGDISLFAAEQRAVEPLARYAMGRIPLIPRIISRYDTVSTFWQTFQQLNLPVLFDRRQIVYTLDPQDLSADPEPLLRPARFEEAEQVARLASAMSFEEIQLDPFRDYPASYLRLIEQRIRLGRYFVLVEDGEIKFQVHVNALTPHAAQVTGVYTPPRHRGKGYARRGMGEFCRLALGLAPRLCLFVNDFNKPALALYERLGFKEAMHYRAIFLEPRP